MIRARHSWPAEQRHHTRRVDPCTTSFGVSDRLRKRLHSIATAGKRAASELVNDTRSFAQNGHPARRGPVRDSIVASQTWSGPATQRHHTRFLHPTVTSAGVSVPFRSRCHWRATSGSTRRKEL